MHSMNRSNVGRWIVMSACCAGAAVLIFGTMVPRATGEPMDQSSSPAMQLTKLGMKFDGARTCAGSGCHDKAGDDAPPAEPGHELTIWTAHDHHAKAFDTLAKPESAEMGKKLSIADVKTSERCLSCHALNVPQNLQGEKFRIKEGNTCGSCHGPSEKWLKPHAEKGWTDKQRGSMDHDGLLKQLGLFDTKPAGARAQLCASCHLAIDADLVANGHPQPTFEIAYYSEIEPPHWKIADGYGDVKLWAAGQAACLRDAMRQLASRAKANAGADAIKAAYEQAMAHASVFAAAAPALGVDAGALSSHTSAMSKASTDAAVLGKEADAVAEMASQALAKVDSFNPDKAAAAKILTAIASQTDMAKNFGQFGMDQQSMSISSLFHACAKGDNMPDAARDEVSKLIESKLFPPENGELSAEQFDKNVPEVAAKLPK